MVQKQVCSATQLLRWQNFITLKYMTTFCSCSVNVRVWIWPMKSLISCHRGVKESKNEYRHLSILKSLSSHNDNWGFFIPRNKAVTLMIPLSNYSFVSSLSSLRLHSNFSIINLKWLENANSTTCNKRLTIISFYIK